MRYLLAVLCILALAGFSLGADLGSPVPMLQIEAPRTPEKVISPDLLISAVDEALPDYAAGYATAAANDQPLLVYVNTPATEAPRGVVRSRARTLFGSNRPRLAVMFPKRWQTSWQAELPVSASMQDIATTAKVPMQAAGCPCVAAYGYCPCQQASAAPARIVQQAPVYQAPPQYAQTFAPAYFGSSSGCAGGNCGSPMLSMRGGRH